jgi:hypothetical protein
LILLKNIKVGKRLLAISIRKGWEGGVGTA